MQNYPPSDFFRFSVPIAALMHLTSMRGTIRTINAWNSTRRFSRLALVAILVTLVPAPSAIADQFSPPPTTSSDPTMQCGNDPNPTGCDPGVYVWGSVWVSGFVKNALGIGIEGATVSGGDGPSQTDSLGYYITRVYYSSNQPHFTLTASKPGYESRAKRVSVWEASVGNIDFSLPYALTPALTPSVFNSSQDRTLSLEVRTAAPGDSTEVWLQLETGGIQSLIHTGTESGLELWATSIAVSQGAPDGIRNLKVCSVSSGSTGNCDALTIGTKASASVPISYTVDSTPPSITNPSPRPNHNTLLRQPWINAWVSDPLSGINWSTVSISLTHPDGSTSSASGAYFFPSSALALGVHTATVSAADLVGNAATSTWQFNVTTLEASAALGRLEEQSVDVNPQGKVIGAPTTVTFSNVKITLDQYALTIGASPYAGYGEFSRSADLSGAGVIFTNETGVPSEPINPRLSPAVFFAKAGLLFPESVPTTASIGLTTHTVPSITVEVPTGYNTQGSKATLSMAPSSALPISSASDQVIHLAIPQGTGLIDATLNIGTETLDESPSHAALSASQWIQASVSASFPETAAALGHLQVFRDLRTCAPPGSCNDSDAFVNEPALACGGSQTDSSCVFDWDPGDGVEKVMTSKWYLKVGPIKLFANHFLYRRATESTYVDWQQTSAKVNPAVCSPGRTGSISAGLNEFTNESTQLLHPTSPWEISNFRMTDVGEDSNAVTLPWVLNGSTNSLSNTGQHSLSSIFDADPPYDAGEFEIPGRTKGTWNLDSAGSLSTALEQMITATEWNKPDSAAYPKAMSLLGSHTWSISQRNSCV